MRGNSLEYIRHSPFRDSTDIRAKTSLLRSAISHKLRNARYNPHTILLHKHCIRPGHSKRAFCIYCTFPRMWCNTAFYNHGRSLQGRILCRKRCRRIRNTLCTRCKIQVRICRTRQRSNHSRSKRTFHIEYTLRDMLHKTLFLACYTSLQIGTIRTKTSLQPSQNAKHLSHTFVLHTRQSLM